MDCLQFLLPNSSYSTSLGSCHRFLAARLQSQHQNHAELWPQVCYTHAAGQQLLGKKDEVYKHEKPLILYAAYSRHKSIYPSLQARALLAPKAKPKAKQPT
jgi:hypothetical protein